MYIAGIEAGGTKFLCGIGDEKAKLYKSVRLDTRDPESTRKEALEFFLTCRKEGYDFKALGIGSFGPVDLDPESATWGYITSTPKPAWANTDLAPWFAANLGIPVAFDTDVQTAALYEARFGAGLGKDPLVYLTIGTGIGGGLIVQGKSVPGLMHPEMGHVYLKRHPEDAYPGFCPFHGDCAEGLASGPAMKGRWSRPAQDLPPDHEAWNLEAWYLAQLLVNLQMVISPKRIVLGGGVSLAPGLMEKILSQAPLLSAGYLASPKDQEAWKDLVKPASSPVSGLLGAFVLGADLLSQG